MSFLKKIWTDRSSEYPNRRILTNEDNTTNVVTVARDEGIISQQGDAFSATNMNDLEDRVEVGFDELNSNLTKTQSNTHSVTINGVAFGSFSEKRNLNTVSITFTGSGAFSTIGGNTEYTCASLTNAPASNFFAIALVNAGVSNQSYAYLQFKTNRTVSITFPEALNSIRTLRFSVTYLAS